MLDLNSTRPGLSPELRPVLTMLAAVIAQAVKDAGAPTPKKTRQELGGGAGHITEADIRGAVYFLFDPGRLEFFTDKVGFEAESFRCYLVCGTAAPWEPVKAAGNDCRDIIRARAINYGFQKEVQRLDDLWRLRHG